MNMRDEFECVMREQREIARAHGRAVRSAHTICDLAALFAAKIPRYQETIDAVGDDLILYEITCDTAIVTVDMEHIERIRL